MTNELDDKPKEKRPAHRPSSYTDQIADAICARLSGGESLLGICADPGMPARATVLRWLGIHDYFRDKYALAREIQADAIFDDILNIADDGTNDWMAKNDPENPGYAYNGEAVRRSQMRIDARKWMAGKLRPKKYGERIVQEVTGADGAPLVPETSILDDARKIALALTLGLKETEKADDEGESAD